MRSLTMAMAACTLAAGAASAEECAVEDWRHSYIAVMQALTVEGVTTCKAGTIQLRLYDGEGEARRFIGVETAYIEGYIFEAILLQAEKPEALSIKYNIDPE